MTSSSGSDTVRIPLNQCKKVFVQRDYSRGLAVQFHNDYPVELQGLIDEQTWQRTISSLNRCYAEAESVGGRSVFETLFGCATCYMSHFCLTSQYEKKLSEIAKLLEEQNKSIYVPSGVFLTDPMERGLRVMEISFLNQPAPVRPSNNPAQPMLQPEREIMR